MLMYPDVLSSADIDADGIVAISRVNLSVQLYMGLGLGTVAKSLWRNAAAIEAYGYYCPSVRLPHFEVSPRLLTNLLKGIS